MLFVFNFPLNCLQSLNQIIDLINVNRNQFIVTTTLFTLVSNSFNRDSATAIFKNFNMCAWLEGIFHD